MAKRNSVRTSAKVASAAGKVLSKSSTSKTVKKIAASALSNRKAK